jgi:hypothetical protein
MLYFVLVWNLTIVEILFVICYHIIYTPIFSFHLEVAGTSSCSVVRVYDTQ